MRSGWQRQSFVKMLRGRRISVRSVLARSNGLGSIRPLSTIIGTYKDSILLPQTTFPMQSPRGEEATRPLIDMSGAKLYKWQQSRPPVAGRGKEFRLHDGPPYANGHLHIGHFLNKIIKDVINRQKLMSGNRIHFLPGWDCHGLPIEQKAIKEAGGKLQQMKLRQDPIALRRVCRAHAENVMKDHMKEMRSWAIMADWDQRYCTMDSSYEAEQLRVFSRLVSAGMLYRDHKPVHWSPSSRTALAEAELEYKESHRSQAAFIRFPLGPEFGGEHEKDLAVIVWTTTPWTIAGNVAVAYKPDALYAVCKYNGQTVIVAEERAGELQRISDEPIVHLRSFRAEDFAGGTVKHPITKRLVPLIASPHVTDTSGTGLVHIAPAHGPEDFELSKVHNLPLIDVCDEYGIFTAAAGSKLEGKPVLGLGGRAIMALMRKAGNILFEEPYKHSYPYDWRTKEPVIQRATPQWFAKLDGIRDAALKALESVTLVPEGGKRLHSMIATRDEWCISRQRAWGVPIPVFYHKESKKPLLDVSCIEHVAGLFELHGSDCWWSLPVKELLAPAYKADAHLYERGSDTMDVWFDSGVSWASATKAQALNQADLVVEGSDQHRGWFQSSLLTAIASGRTEAPFRSILTHGFVLDFQKKKMSKSTGNTVCPSELLKMGTPIDVMRVWVCSADFTSDVAISRNIMGKSFELMKKLRNTCRFLLGALLDFAVEKRVAAPKLRHLDRYLLHQLHILIAQVDTLYKQHNYARLLQYLVTFCTQNLSSLYLTSCKDRLYSDAPESERRRCVQTVLSYCLPVITKSMAPITVLTAEELYQHMSPGLQACFHNEGEPLDAAPSVFMNGWLPDLSRFHDPVLVANLQLIFNLKSKINKLMELARKDKVIGSAFDAHVAVQLGPSKMLSALNALGEDEFEEILSISSVEISGDGVRKDDSRTSICQTPVSIQVSAHSGKKCCRCWKFSHQINAEFDLCPRCVALVRPLSGMKASAA